jgi:para-aminobenzoate synthetase component 1
MPVHEVKQKIYAALNGQDGVACLDSCECDSSFYPRSVEFIAGWEGDVIYPSSLDELYRSWESTRAWHLGMISYDVKNQLEHLHSENPKIIELPEIAFLIPKYIIIIDSENRVWSNHQDIEARVLSTIEDDADENRLESVNWDRDKENYIQAVDAIRNHIVEGDIYEMNLCVSARIEGYVNPLHTYKRLIDHSPTPFAGYLQLGSKYAISASPERYLNKVGQRLMSQPIKGTMPRSHDPILDLENRERLLSSEKDRSENIMIVDLVRNDLARCCQPGSVHVDELFGIYSFSNVHQMISSVSGQIRNDQTWVDVLQASFPMGSMTGAPKIRSMELIEHYERFQRQWYSGALGYITPTGDFDFNVMIRSLFYDSALQKGYWGVGGAITYDSDPEMEWNEVHVKARALRSVLGTDEIS